MNSCLVCIRILKIHDSWATCTCKDNSSSKTFSQAPLCNACNHSAQQCRAHLSSNYSTMACVRNVVHTPLLSRTGHHTLDHTLGHKHALPPFSVHTLDLYFMYAHCGAFPLRASINCLYPARKAMTLRASIAKPNSAVSHSAAEHGTLWTT